MWIIYLYCTIDLANPKYHSFFKKVAVRNLREAHGIPFAGLLKLHKKIFVDKVQHTRFTPLSTKIHKLFIVCYTFFAAEIGIAFWKRGEETNFLKLVNSSPPVNYLVSDVFEPNFRKIINFTLHPITLEENAMSLFVLAVGMHSLQPEVSYSMVATVGVSLPWCAAAAKLLGTAVASIRRCTGKVTSCYVKVEAACFLPLKCLQIHSSFRKWA